MNSTAFEALADENRAAIVELLADGERCVCDVSESLGISSALASHHLKRLREAGLVATRRKGAWLHCRLEDGAIMAIVDELRGLVGRDSVDSNGPAGGPACCARRGDDHE